jgi:hypothetical protein
MQPRVKSILNHCHRPGAYLRKSYQCARGGSRKRGGAFFLEPGSIEVPAQYALEAIATGKLCARVMLGYSALKIRNLRTCR